LYNINEDFNERINLASKNPEKLKALQAVFDQEAKKYNVYPLIDNSQVPGPAGRARSVYGKSNKIVLYPGVEQFMTYSGPQFQAQSFSVTAEVDLKNKKEQGVLFADGDEFDGLSLYIKDGKFQVAHNTGSIVRYLQSDKPLPSGKVKLTFELNYIAPPKTKEVKGAPKVDLPAGTEAIYINGVKAGERNILASEAKYIANYKDGLDVGQDTNSPVTEHYQSPFKFTGALERVIIEYK